MSLVPQKGVENERWGGKAWQYSGGPDVLTHTQSEGGEVDRVVPRGRGNARATGTSTGSLGGSPKNFALQRWGEAEKSGGSHLMVHENRRKLSGKSTRRRVDGPIKKTLGRGVHCWPEKGRIPKLV